MIRLAKTEDTADIAALFVDIRLDTVPAVHSEEAVFDFISGHLLPRGSSYVWVLDGEILGWVDVHDGWLDQLYCRRGSTGQGFGKILLEFAKERSPEGLHLYTFQINHGARRFYAREGFVEVELGDGSENEEGAPDVKLSWTRQMVST